VATPVWARRYLLAVGALGLPLAIAGFALDGTLSDFFATNPALNVLHLCTAVVALGLGLWPLRPRAAVGERAAAELGAP
jgi:hypothetical protein